MFDTIDELLRKIKLGEDSVLELKAVYFKGNKIAGPKREELADELAAMANSNDGICVLGVDDKTREIAGILLENLDAVELFIREICNDVIKPPLSVKIIRMELPDAAGVMRPIIKVDIPRSLFVHKSPGGYFRRLGNSKRELTPEQLARLFQQRSQSRFISFDEQTVPGTSLADLDETLRRRFIAVSPGDPLATLRKLKLISTDEANMERATVAGVLLCSRHPEAWLPGAYIEAVRYRGVRQDSNYQADAARITGPLDQQVAHAMAFVRRNMTVAAVKSPARVEIPQFSERAVFEAIVNAVAHRDYSIHGSKIRLFMFDDRFELYSPGALPNTVTIESLTLRQATRNELITSLLARCPVETDDRGVGRQYLMEKRGDGVPIIMRESHALSGKYPEYRLIDDAELLLTIFSASQPNQLPMA
jgi:predicted HTH transcriptional regulator